MDIHTLIKHNIDKLANNSENLRKAVDTDFFGCDYEKNDNNLNNNEKVKKYRLQAEYGEKKFIKP